MAVYDAFGAPCGARGIHNKQIVIVPCADRGFLWGERTDKRIIIHCPVRGACVAIFAADPLLHRKLALCATLQTINRCVEI